MLIYVNTMLIYANLYRQGTAGSTLKLVVIYDNDMLIYVDSCRQEIP